MKRAAVDAAVNGHTVLIKERFHGDLVKRWPGYGLDRYLASPGDLSKIAGGSEGTLAAVTSAVLKLVSLPAEKGLGLIFFRSVDEAMQATVALLDLEPAAIEHVDRVLLDQTKGHPAFRAARDFLRIDAEPCEAFLLVEFYGHVADRLDALAQRKLGVRTQMCTGAEEMALVWGLRKAGLSLLTSRKGPAKPVAGLEDVCVRPKHLPEYVSRLEKAIEPLGLLASFYGHAASGLVHVRPVVDMHRAEDIAKFRKVAEASAALAREFDGSFAGEHGIGMARTEFMGAQVGPELLGVMRAIKSAFDPENLFNPGKIIPDGRYRIDTHLRQGAGHALALPFEPMLAYAKKDGSFVDHLEQCNGCGDCRKDPPTMCPTFSATGEEMMVTRGRANAIRAAIEHRLDDGTNALTLASLDTALSNCLSCKACQAECPSNVDMGLLKSELVHARHQVAGVSLRERVFSRVDLVNVFGSLVPALTNAFLRAPWFRALLESVLGISAKRPLPSYAPQRFDRWFARRTRPAAVAPRGRVILWDDCFVRHNEPNIGKAATRVLEAAGFDVVLPEGRACCGRPAFSMGCLDVAARFGRHNVDVFKRMGGNAPIIFLEASCYSMFAQDYRELKVAGAEDLSPRCVLFEQFMHDLLEQDPEALSFTNGARKTAIHGHCHAKALINAAVMPALAGKIPGNDARLLESGCCGMAGAFGAMASKYELSLDVAAPLVDMINALEPGTHLVASGTSCRHQIGHLTDAQPLHMAELLACSCPKHDSRGDGMKAPIGIGVLSFAHGHVITYMDVMKQFDDVRLVAAYDDSEDRAAPVCADTGMKYTPHVEDVLGNPEVQAVIVGSETNRHAELCAAAAAAGKHILCQKPMALTLEDCDTMIDAAERAGVTLAMAFQMRHDPANIKMRELVQAGALGRVAVVRRRHCIGVLFMEDFLNGPAHWHVETDKNLGMFMDDAAHPADWLHWVFGSPVSVIAEIDNVVTDVAPDDNGVAVYRFPHGEMGILFNSSTVLAGENTTEIYGDKGCLIQNYGDGPSTGVPRCPDGPALKLYHYDTGIWETFDIPVPESQASRIRAVPRPWVDSLIADTAPAATAQDGRIAAEMVLGAYRAAREGRRVSFPLDN